MKTDTSTQHLLVEIARCPVASSCLAEGRPSHPCSTVVQIQGHATYADFQVPEPWSGRIETAPLLFLSSNPSISSQDVYPRGNWPDNQIVDFFSNRFGGGRKLWIQHGTKALAETGSHMKATNFWAGVKQRAIELLGPGVVPGTDYALTEIVHCKSRSEIGVIEAQSLCTDLYLNRILAASGAKIVVVLGRAAKDIVCVQLGIGGNVAVHGPANLWGQTRIITFLPHPNARGDRTFSKCLTGPQVAILRDFLNR